MSGYLIGLAAGPFIGLAVGFAVAWCDPDGYLRQSRRAKRDAR